MTACCGMAYVLALRAALMTERQGSLQKQDLGYTTRSKSNHFIIYLIKLRLNGF